MNFITSISRRSDSSISHFPAHRAPSASRTSAPPGTLSRRELRQIVADLLG
ncbi:hypothetical protein [Sphingomonas abietis]|uniref:Uncharacterized protein n=1 Tax=Sphingomonas abietis TaxID=3012344 RepID=A0ABY7NNL4_9SPHN|nr:hypothetical protein [Sphingomonas abietis]WBO23108.1 hypothetical protein PBT88_02915 [Sphingomonas abietis]